MGRSVSPLLRIGLQTAFGLMVLGLWLRVAPIDAAWRQAHVVRWWPIAAIVVLACVSFALRAWRWSRLVKPISDVRLLDAMLMNAAGGLLNFLLPIRSGEAARAWWLARRYGVPAGSGVATIIVDKRFHLASGADLLAIALAALYGV